MTRRRRARARNSAGGPGRPPARRSRATRRRAGGSTRARRRVAQRRADGAPAQRPGRLARAARQRAAGRRRRRPRCRAARRRRDCRGGRIRSARRAMSSSTPAVSPWRAVADRHRAAPRSSSATAGRRKVQPQRAAAPAATTGVVVQARMRRLSQPGARVAREIAREARDEEAAGERPAVEAAPAEREQHAPGRSGSCGLSSSTRCASIAAPRAPATSALVSSRRYGMRRFRAMLPRMIVDEQAEVLGNRTLSAEYNVVTLGAATIAAAARPGQFVMIKTKPGLEPLLRRPFSIFEILRDRDGTPHRHQHPQQAHRHRHGQLFDVARRRPPRRASARSGGRGRWCDPPAEAWMVAGGVGLAPFATLAEALGAARHLDALFYGARRGEDLYYADWFDELGVRARARHRGRQSRRARASSPCRSSRARATRRPTRRSRSTAAGRRR